MEIITSRAAMTLCLYWVFTKLTTDFLKKFQAVCYDVYSLFYFLEGYKNNAYSGRDLRASIMWTDTLLRSNNKGSHSDGTGTGK